MQNKQLPIHNCKKPKYCEVCYNFIYYWTHKTAIQRRKKLDRQRNPKKYANQYKKWYTNNKKYVIKTHNKINTLRRRNDPLFALSCRLRTSLRTNLQKNIKGKIRYLAFTIAQLYKDFERKFKKRMSWGNISRWHIDHIIPLKYKLPSGKYYWNQQSLLNPKALTFKSVGLKEFTTYVGKANIPKVAEK